MKNIIRILTITILSLSLYSQDKEPTVCATFNYKYYNSSGQLTSESAPLSVSKFPQRNFLLGWHWGAFPKMTEALGMNMDMGSDDKPFFQEGQYDFRPQVKKIDAIIGAVTIQIPWYAQSFQYEPTLQKFDNREGQVVQRPDESVPAIFGFKSINSKLSMVTLSDVNVAGKMKYLTKVDNSNFIPSDFTNEQCLILSNNWPNDKFRGYFERIIAVNTYNENGVEIKRTEVAYEPKNRPEGKFEDRTIKISTDEEFQYNGAEWFLTINLRKTGTSEGRPDGKILKLIVKSRTHNKEGTLLYHNIKFEALTNILQTKNVNYFKDGINSLDDRGITLEFGNNVTQETTEFIITKSMLGKALNDNFITLSARFNTKARRDKNGNLLPNDNPMMKPEEGNMPDSKLGYLETFDIEVYYYKDACSAEIDWIRLENTIAKNLFAGMYDGDPNPDINGQKYKVRKPEYSLLHLTNSSSLISIQNQVQEYINMTTSSVTTSSQVHNFFRIHTESSDDGLFIFNWGAIRYLNKAFLNGLATNAQGVSYPDLYYYYVGSTDRWVGCHKFYTHLASPFYLPNSTGISDYIKDLFTNPDQKDEFGIKGDKFWTEPCRDNKEVFDSRYETWFKESGGGTICKNNTNPFVSNLRLSDGKDLNLLKSLNYNIRGLQANWEFSSGGGSIDIYSNNPEFLYRDDQVWWGQAFVDHRFLIYRKLDGKFALKTYLMKPLTGEEVNLMDWSMILKGAKGLIYDGPGANKYINDFIEFKDNQYIYHYATGAQRVERMNTLTIFGKNVIYDKLNDLFIDPLVNPANIKNTLANNFNNPSCQYLTESNPNYWEYIKRDALGVDFASIPDNPESGFTPSLYDSTYIGLFLTDKAQLGNYIGFGGNRFYLGLKSRRIALKQIHEWCNENSNLLMSLRLRAWYGKGFIKQYNQKMTDYNYYDANGLKRLKGDLLRNYVSLPSEQDWFTGDINKAPIKVRPIDRIKDGKPFYEPPDSTFYDVTLLKELKKDANGEFIKTNGEYEEVPNIFYLGIQNRRTDGLIVQDNCLNPSDNNHYCVDFYSTAEFDKNVVTGGNDLTQAFKDKIWWQSKWFKRLGCREISIPLNLGPEFRNKLVKVTEKSRSSASIQAQHEYNGITLKTEEINKLYPAVNKVIGYDGTITAKYLPGEGKLFKCEILDLKNPILGSLAHSNQCKLIAYPEYDNNGNETGVIRYHVVYFKEDPNVPANIKVYYNRSQKINVNSQNPQIEWEDPVGRVISDGFLINSSRMNSSECDYPSIVLRKENNKLTAYVAYTCKEEATNPSSYVNVTYFDVTNPGFLQKSISEIPGDYSNPAIHENQNIAKIATLDRNEWGNPVINANSNGNFYVFSDPGQQQPVITPSAIRIFFGVNSAIPTSQIDICSPSFNDWDIPSVASLKHPSVNTYSFSTNNNLTDIVSLVLQASYKKPNTENVINKILFTKLQQINNVTNFVTPDNDLPSTKQIKRNTNNAPSGIFNKVIMLNAYDYMINSSFPVVYSTKAASDYDYIYYHNQWPVLPQLSLSFISGITFRKPSTYPLIINYTENIVNFNKYNYSISQPNISQPGQILPLDFSNNPNFNPNNGFNLNMQMDGNTYHYFGNMHLKLFPFFNIYTSAYRLIELNTSQSHLSNSPSNNANSPWMNRRVFNDANNNIRTTASYFYNITPEDIIAENQIGFRADTASLFIGVPKLKNQYLAIERPVQQIYADNDSSLAVISKDTLWTKSFTLTTDTLELKVTGIDTAGKFVLKYPDNYLLQLSVPGTIKLDSARIIRHCFYNGEGLNFQLGFVRTDTMTRFTENSVPGGIPIKDTVYFTYNLQRPIVNSASDLKLKSNSIYLDINPIPAKDIVNITARLPENAAVKDDNKGIEIKLITFDGKELLSTTISSGVTKSISLDKFSQGVYFIRAEAEDLKLRDEIQAATKQFIIER